MAEENDSLIGKLEKLKASIEQLAVKEKKAFSQKAIQEFYRGFDHPVIGLLAYLKEHITYYNTIECTVTGDLINEISISDYNTYQQLLEELEKISPKTRLDFTFRLSNGIFSFLVNIQEFFSVFFSEDNYEIEYEFEDKQHLTLSKDYETHITPDEIRQLRDRITESIYCKVSAKIDTYA
jgi:hypothetical protein